MKYFKIDYTFDDSKSLYALEEFSKKLLSLESHQGICLYTKKFDINNPFQSIKNNFTKNSFYLICEDLRLSIFSDLLAQYEAQEVDTFPSSDLFESSVGDSSAIANK